MTEGDKSVKSVHRTFDVIEGLRELDTAGVTELAEHVDIPVSTVHSYLSALRERRYVVQDGDKYRLANRFTHLGDYVKRRLDLYRVGHRHVRNLAKRTGETANIMVSEYGMGIYLMSVSGKEGLRNYSYVRPREYLHTTAAGKAILMMKDEAGREAVIDRHGLPAVTDHSITDRETLHERLDAARERGYTNNDEENTNGIRATGAPVQRTNGEYAAVSLSGPLSYVTDEIFETEFPQLVTDTARSIELELIS